MAECSINVCMRCRPFVKDDQLGIRMEENNGNGEVEVLHSKYSTNRFAFTHAWWSAFGYERHLKGPEGKGDPSPEDVQIANNMTLVDQKMAYDKMGKTIMGDLLGGNAVVLFAYGLSGSGKTFTVFGPDATDAPEAWFKHADPHNLWGIFPHLAYNLFKEKKDGWKITMKYFQNVVDTVRDLMSPMAKEMNYKKGMSKDKDGFTDIAWIESQVLDTWDDLRNAFMAANARKAIAPTQFNHQSTRGHCIMTLEVEMPHPTQPGIKQIGRLYVCDLAGTEPAGDIVYANYKKVTHDNGDLEYEYLGPHPDQSKTKELQDQGKKINLSLSEMASFFLKMAKAVKEKKLASGQSIPGCNSYFLCRYLKDTMLQSKTYLFCAIRPEVQFHKYTFATLGFAKNASVIKLAPKKAGTSAQSKREIQLMQELEKLKAMLASQGSHDPAEMEKMLAEKQQQLRTEMAGEADEVRKRQMEKEKQEYASRGISLSVFEPEPAFPHFVNLDEDSFRDHRFLFLLSKELTTFGSSGCDIKPLNMAIEENHCSVERKGDKVFMIGGKGSVYVNGEQVNEGQRVELKKHDRVVIGQDIMLFKNAFSEEDRREDEPEARAAFAEYNRAVQAKDSAFQEQAKKLEEDKRKLMEELERMKAEGQSASDIESKRMAVEAWKGIDESMREMVPVISRLNDMFNKVGRGMLHCKLSLQQPKVNMPFVKVQIKNTETETVVFLDPFEVQSILNILQDQILALKTKDMYIVPQEEEIMTQVFDTSYQIGSCTNFLLHCALLMETDEDERQFDVMKSVIPYNKIGTLDVFWQPVTGPEDESEPEEITEPEELIGKTWTYKLKIGALTDLPTQISEAYVVYEFNGQRYVTDTIQLDSPARKVDFNYSEILHIECVDEAFLKYLDEVEFKFEIFIKPHIACNKPPLSNTDKKICENLGIEAKEDPEVVALRKDIAVLQKENESLKAELQLVRQKSYDKAAKEAISGLEAVVAHFRGNSKLKSKLADAKATDSQLNN